MTDDAVKREAEDKKAAEEQERREAQNRKEIAGGGDLDIQHFDTTITKLVERENADGEMETVEVMSDNLYPGERLKSEQDAEDKERDAELARARASVVSDERRKADDEALKRHAAAAKDAKKDQSGVTKAK
jgi:hypothetical protein